MLCFCRQFVSGPLPELFREGVEKLMYVIGVCQSVMGEHRHRKHQLAIFFHAFADRDFRGAVFAVMMACMRDAIEGDPGHG